MSIFCFLTSNSRTRFLLLPLLFVVFSLAPKAQGGWDLHSESKDRTYRLYRCLKTDNEGFMGPNSDNFRWALTLTRDTEKYPRLCNFKGEKLVFRAISEDRFPDALCFKVQVLGGPKLEAFGKFLELFLNPNFFSKPNTAKSYGPTEPESQMYFFFKSSHKDGTQFALDISGQLTNEEDKKTQQKFGFTQVVPHERTPKAYRLPSLTPGTDHLFGSQKDVLIGATRRAIQEGLVLFQKDPLAFTPLREEVKRIEEEALADKKPEETGAAEENPREAVKEEDVLSISVGNFSNQNDQVSQESFHQLLDEIDTFLDSHKNSSSDADDSSKNGKSAL